MSFWDFFGKKDRANGAADSGAVSMPMSGAADSEPSATDAAPQGGNDTGAATSTDSGDSSFGGDAGGASGGDGGGGI